MLPDVERVAKLTPGLRIVIDHLPFRNWDGDPRTARRALTRIAGLPNVYAKISDVARRVDGRIVEEGSPEELIRRGGRFAALVELETAGWDWQDSV